MRIHHFTVPAHDPERVARVLAELLGAKVIPIPKPPGTLIVYAGDADGSLIEIMPAATRGGPGDHELVHRDLPLPEAWPHHGFVTTDALDADRILATFAREGWKAELAHNGPPHAGHGIVGGWIENHTLIEMGGHEIREQYERFLRELGARA